jgi:hypothetical protein
MIARREILARQFLREAASILLEAVSKLVVRRVAYRATPSLLFQIERVEAFGKPFMHLLCFSFAFLPVEDWFHPSAAPLRRAGLCVTRFSRLSFVFSPHSEYVPPSLAQLDLVRNLA